MKNRLIGAVAGGVLAAVLEASAADAQAPPATQQGPAAVQNEAALTPGRLDQMLAPIALYPDDLLGQILMAATYPLDVVEAARWVKDPRNESLKGDQLFAALQQQNWDPSVKSLAPFRSILAMMDASLEWTERLGEAFLADPEAVMDAVQRLRRRAQSAGRFAVTPQVQEIVRTAPEAITIETPSPEIVYVPVCNPSVVYGGWPYPDYPPYFFGNFFNGATIGGFGCGSVNWPIVPQLWGWAVLIFVDHHIHISRDKFLRIDKNRPPIGGDEWRHDPSRRGNVPYQNAALAARYDGAAPTRESVRAFRDSPARLPPLVAGPAARPTIGGERAQPLEGNGAAAREMRAFRDYPARLRALGDGPVARPTIGGERALPLEGIDPDRRAFVPGEIESYSRGTLVEQGLSSRTSAPPWTPRGGGGPYVSPLTGGIVRAPPSLGAGVRGNLPLGAGIRAPPLVGAGIRAAPLGMRAQ
jgi:hypothetical protein